VSQEAAVSLQKMGTEQERKKAQCKQAISHLLGASLPMKGVKSAGNGKSMEDRRTVRRFVKECIGIGGEVVR